VPAPSQFSDADLPTVEAVIEQKRRETRASSVAPLAETPEPSVPVAEPSVAGLESPEALEQEAGQQGAFNPETGEINWDCPCLGGMADGPCGEDFKAAFSCFVFSEAEPKGMDCIDKFQHMQDCFRQYPDIYGAELQEDDDEPIAGDAGDTPEPLAGTEALASTGPVATTQETLAQTAQKADRQLPVESTEDVQVPKDEHPGIPTAAVDATTANDGKIAEAPGKQ
jgi:intermembrane space import and assembly protein 40